MKNKKISFLVLILVVLLILWIALFNFFKKDEIIWTYITDTEFEQEIFNINEETNNWEVDNKIIKEKIKKDEEDQKDFAKIWSMVRTICKNYSNIKWVVNSTSFLVIKNELNKISKEVNINRDNFTYVVLPWIVFENCNNDDDSFSDSLLSLLQTDWNEIIVSTQEDLNLLYSFINEIKFNSTDIDQNKLKTSKYYFYEIFFQNNLKPLINSYFFKATHNSDDIKEYIYTNTLMSLSESNTLLEKTVWNFQDFLSDLWFKDLKEFQNYILKNNSYNSLEELKDDAIKTYSELSVSIKEKLSYNLDEQIISLDSLIDFYNSDRYENLKENEEIYNKYKKLSDLYLYFSIISDDYADNLNEWWSWKQFFWDTLIWNWIIRLAYIHLFEQLNK